MAEVEELVLGSLDRDSMVTIDVLIRLCCVMYRVPKRRLFLTLRYLMTNYCECFSHIRIQQHGYYHGNQVRGRPRLHLLFENKYSGNRYIDGYYPGYGQWPPITVRFQLGIVIRELVHSGVVGVDRFPDRIHTTNEFWFDDNCVIQHTDIHVWEELLGGSPVVIPAFPPTPPASPASSSTASPASSSSTWIYVDDDDDDVDDDHDDDSSDSSSTVTESVCMCFRCINCLGHAAEEAGGAAGGGE